MRINLNTIIYPIFGITFGLNYWSSDMEHVVVADGNDELTEHCLEFHLFVFGISFIWTTDQN